MKLYRVKEILEPLGYQLAPGVSIFPGRNVVAVTHPIKERAHILEVVKLLYDATGIDPEFYRAADGSSHIVIDQPWEDTSTGAIWSREATTLPRATKIFSTWRPARLPGEQEPEQGNLL